MNIWSELLDQALLGTQGNLFIEMHLDSHTPEQTLLKELVLVGAKRRAGFVAPTVKTLPTVDPAPPETLPPCSALALSWYKKLAGSAYLRNLIQDWSLLLIQRRKRVPHSELVTVLNAAVKQPEWGPYLMPVVGERGRWLADRTDAYAALRQPELWSGEFISQLTPAKPLDESIPSSEWVNQSIIATRENMLKELNNE